MKTKEGEEKATEILQHKYERIGILGREEMYKNTWNATAISQ